MTRLTSRDIWQLESALESYDRDLTEKTGLNLRELACLAAGLQAEDWAVHTRGCRAAVVPVTAGEGLIEGFCQSVAAIIDFLGVPAAETVETDIAGLGEALESRADIVFMGDDRRFLAMHTAKGIWADNSEATGRGYAAALWAAARDATNHGDEIEMLVIGLGPVGQSAARFLLEKGFRVAVFDANQAVADSWAAGIRSQQPDGGQAERNLEVLSTLHPALPRFKYILEATSTAGYIGKEALNPQAVIAAPGIPLALDSEARAGFEARLLHDPLQLGVAAMLALLFR